MDYASLMSTPVTLEGDLVRLLPLAPEQAPQLAQASLDGRLWELWYTSAPHPEQMEAEIARRLAEHAAGRMLPFAVQRKDTGALCGMTTYMTLEPRNRRLEIGSTWLAKSAQRSGVNTEAKLLLLRHAFEHIGCIAVEFRTNFMNHQSRAAIARLGAKQDGILRSAVLMPNGVRRDSVIFSILDIEWPAVQQNLQFLLMRGAQKAQADGAAAC